MVQPCPADLSESGCIRARLCWGAAALPAGEHLRRKLSEHRHQHSRPLRQHSGEHAQDDRDADHFLHHHLRCGKSPPQDFRKNGAGCLCVVFLHFPFRSGVRVHHLGSVQSHSFRRPGKTGGRKSDGPCRRYGRKSSHDQRIESISGCGLQPFQQSL